MNASPVETKHLRLVLQTREDVRTYVAQMQPQDRATLSAAWLALLDGSSPADPWIHGFTVVHRDTGDTVGRCGFKGPPDGDGVVEIAYAVNPEHEGKGYATEAAGALVSHAFSHGQVRVVRAHTLPEWNASTRVLTKCGFRRVGEVVDPEDGLVWRWERVA
ncbi:MAG TPA: GNAT family N-acetyltransferase [Verrucomicrobiota bacterium]|nr:GNAT family N-acetyltransferase [Verrucomicrobiota bacterium]